MTQKYGKEKREQSNFSGKAYSQPAIAQYGKGGVRLLNAQQYCQVYISSRLVFIARHKYSDGNSQGGAQFRHRRYACVNRGQARERPLRLQKPAKSSRYGARPEPTATVRMRENEAEVARGGCFHPIFQTGNWYIIIIKHGVVNAPDQPSILEEILKKVWEVRERDGRESKTSMGIIDSQSVKDSESAREKGYDGGKKVSGIKRHVAAGTNGLPHALGVSKANAGDREGTIQLFETNKGNL